MKIQIIFKHFDSMCNMYLYVIIFYVYFQAPMIPAAFTNGYH